MMFAIAARELRGLFLSPLAWTLLAPHNAAAAKLRQLAPALQAALAAAGHPVSTLRVKVAQPLR